LGQPIAPFGQVWSWTEAIAADETSTPILVSRSARIAASLAGGRSDDGAADADGAVDADRDGSADGDAEGLSAADGAADAEAGAPVEGDADGTPGLADALPPHATTMTASAARRAIRGRVRRLSVLVMSATDTGRGSFVPRCLP
jgi:hypothetical protein